MSMSPQEKKVRELRKDGKSLREIAEMLNISRKDVEVYFSKDLADQKAADTEQKKALSEAPAPVKEPPELAPGDAPPAKKSKGKKGKKKKS